MLATSCGIRLDGSSSCRFQNILHYLSCALSQSSFGTLLKQKYEKLTKNFNSLHGKDSEVYKLLSLWMQQIYLSIFFRRCQVKNKFRGFPWTMFSQMIPKTEKCCLLVASFHKAINCAWQPWQSTALNHAMYFASGRFSPIHFSSIRNVVYFVPCTEGFFSWTKR